LQLAVEGVANPGLLLTTKAVLLLDAPTEAEAAASGPWLGIAAALVGTSLASAAPPAGAQPKRAGAAWSNAATRWGSSAWMPSGGSRA